MDVSKKRILIADTSLSIQKLVHLAFAERDFEVLNASDGADALQKARTQRPDFILADCQLNIIDGMSLVEKVRKERGLGGTRIVLLKSANDVALDHRIKEVRPDAVLVKPFDAKGLTKTIGDLEDEISRTTAPIDEDEKTLTLSASSDEESTITLKEPTSSKGSTPSQKRLEEIAVGVLLQEPTTRSVKEASDEFSQIAEREIHEWIHQNMAAIAERLIKEEISRKLPG